MVPIRRLLAGLLLWLAATMPAQAAVTVTFWSHELGNDFPHAYFSLRGVPDRGGPAVDVNYGFTASTITPAILFGPVPSRIDIAQPGYMRGSDAQFSLEITDRQYDELLQLAAEWGTPGFKYLMNTRNCVHFTAEAARRLGLAGTDQPKLMKKPRSYMQALMAANPGRVTVIAEDGKDYLAKLQPLTVAAVAPMPRITPPRVVPTLRAAPAIVPAPAR